MIAKNTKSAYFALILAFLGLLINFWAWSLLSPLGSTYASELSLDPAKLSLLLALPVLVGSFGRIPLGALTDKYGGHKIFAMLCFATFLPVFGLIFANSYIQMISLAVLLGVGGASFVVGVPYVSSWFAPAKRGLVLGLYSIGNGGTAVSGFMTPRLAESVGKDTTFAIVGFLLILMGLIFVFFAKPSKSWQPVKSGFKAKLASAFKSKLTKDLSAIYILTFGAYVAFGVYLPVLLKVSYGLSLTDAAARSAGFILLATLARPFGGWLSDKIGGRNIIRITLFTASILSMFVAFQPTLKIQTTIAYLALAFTLGIANGAVFALVGRLASQDNMGSIAGVVGAVGGLGGFLPPLIMGITYQKTLSYTPALVMLSVSSLVVLVYINNRFKDKVVYKNAV